MVIPAANIFSTVSRGPRAGQEACSRERRVEISLKFWKKRPFARHLMKQRIMLIIVGLRIYGPMAVNISFPGDGICLV